MDIVRELGLLTLGSRLKRLGERLQAQTQELLSARQLDIPASHQPLLAALARDGALTVGELVQALGVSQPGVTRQLGKLQAVGLVQVLPNASDLRLRRMSLTAEGEAYVAQARAAAWPAIEAAVADACNGQGDRLLEYVDALEDALAEHSLAARVPQTPRRSRKHASA